MGNKRNKKARTGKGGRPRKKDKRSQTLAATAARKSQTCQTRETNDSHGPDESPKAKENVAPAVLKISSTEEQLRTLPARVAKMSQCIVRQRKQVEFVKRASRFKRKEETEDSPASPPLPASHEITAQPTASTAPPAKQRRYLEVRSHEEEAIKKRLQRDKKKVDPEILARYELVPRDRKVFGPPTQYSVDDSLVIALDLGLSRRKYRKARRMFKDLAPSGQVDSRRQQIFAESGFIEFDENGSKGLVRPLKAAVDELLQSVNVTELPIPLRLTIAVDGGSDDALKSVKMVVHCSDGPKPASAHTCAVYAIILGEETYDNVAHIFYELDWEVDEMQTEGIFVKGEKFAVTFFLVADMKGQCMYMGLIGASALWFCPWCLIHKDDINNYNHRHPPETRSIYSIIKNAEKLLYETNGPLLRGQTLAGVRQQHQSAFDMPLITAIKLSQLVPPILHIGMAVINDVMGEIRKESEDRFQSLLAAAGVDPSTLAGRHHAFTGGNGTKIAHHVADLPAHRRRRDKYLRAINSANDLLKLMKIDANVADSEALIARVIKDFKAVRPLTNKLHTLEVHVPEFIRYHGTWSRMTEQGVENLHRLLNETADNMPGHTPLEVLRCFVKECSIRLKPKVVPLKKPKGTR